MLDSIGNHNCDILNCPLLQAQPNKTDCWDIRVVSACGLMLPLSSTGASLRHRVHFLLRVGIFPASLQKVWVGVPDWASRSFEINQIWEQSRPGNDHEQTFGQLSDKLQLGLSKICLTCDIQSWALLCAVRLNQNWLFLHILIVASDHRELHL